MSIQTQVLLGIALGAWITGGTFLFCCVFDKLRPITTTRASAIGASLAFLFAPCALPVAIPLGAKWLGVGFTELFRALVPRRSRLPKAEVRRTERTP